MAYLDDVYAVVQIQPTGVETFVRLSQNENGRKLYFAIQGGELPSGSTATISGTKPDGVVYSASAAISGNTVTVNEDIQLTAVAGAWPAKLRILNGGQVIATGRIRFVIDADPVAPGSVPSDSELEGLVAEAAAYAEAAKDSAYYGSPLVASTVAGMTDHTRVYVYTGSESGYTNGNWYYWNGSAWTSGGVYNAQGISTDTTLTISGKAADAKATGDRLTAAEDDLSDVKSDLTQIEEDITHIGISESVKVALLDCFAHVAWIDEHGQEYYDALDTALYEEEYPRIVAVFNPGSQTIYVDDDLNTLKQYLVVKYQASRDAADIIIPSSGYTLSGTLAEGNNIVRVAYNDLFTTFTVTAVDYYNQSNWTYPGLLKMMDESAGLSDAGGIGYEMCLNGATTPPVRASFWAQRGISGQLPALRMDGSREQGTYCIPVPDSASHAIVSITPSSQYISIRRMQYDLSTQTWINTRDESGWIQGSVDFAIPESSYMRLVQVNCKFNSGGTAGDLPTGLSITFE